MRNTEEVGNKCEDKKKGKEIELNWISYMIISTYRMNDMPYPFNYRLRVTLKDRDWTTKITEWTQFPWREDTAYR